MAVKRADICKTQNGEGLTCEQTLRVLYGWPDDTGCPTDGAGRLADARGQPRPRGDDRRLPEHSDCGGMDVFGPLTSSVNCLHSLGKLLERDRLREKDGFPRKIRLGRMIRPGQGRRERVVVVPTTVEEKLIHDRDPAHRQEEQASGGSGEGEPGEVIGEQPVSPEDGGDGGGPGQGEGARHELEADAYELGRILTETFELPNLKAKGHKRSLTRETYELTDRNRGAGQILDKKATLRRIVESNVHLGNVTGSGVADPTRLLIAPADRVYRVLSLEKGYESQAVVFFLRDYSGSMSGQPTEIVVAQHVLIYSWLLYQYAQQVETRFILHDTEAREVDDFYTYYNSKVAGGTRVVAAYDLVNRIVSEERLASDHNIYVFHGTDGDDWDTTGEHTLPALEAMLQYANRVGVSVVGRGGASAATEVEQYLRRSNLLQRHRELLRLDRMETDADETRMIEGIKRLVG